MFICVNALFAINGQVVKWNVDILQKYVIIK